MTGAPGADTVLVREALGGLLSIAWDDTPQLADHLHAQLEELPGPACQELLDNMIDTGLLARLLTAEEGATPPLEELVTDLDVVAADRVDAALRPLARLAAGDAGTQALDQLAPDHRARILFAAVNRFDL